VADDQDEKDSKKQPPKKGEAQPEVRVTSRTGQFSSREPEARVTRRSLQHGDEEGEAL
jgi:hypothetical protein